MTEAPSARTSLPVALDAMGGDVGAAVNVEGAVDAIRQDGAKIILVGDEARLHAELDRLGARSLLDGDSLSIRHAPEVVEMDDKPAVAVRKKKASSMRLTCDLVKSGEASAALSAGNSGAMMAMALFVLGRIPGVQRPCIATTYPSFNSAGTSVLADAGANTDCTPEHLLQFGLMAEVFLSQVYGLERPGVGLVSNGTEDTKGTDLTREAFALFEQSTVNFKGYVEGNHLNDGEVSVAVTDGFTGNIMLKTAEGTFAFVIDLIKKTYAEAGMLGKLGGALSKSVFRTIKTQVDPREFGSAPLLGLNAPAFIAHGSSDAYAIRSAIRTARRHVQADVTREIADVIMRNRHLTEREKNAEVAS